MFPAQTGDRLGVGRLFGILSPHASGWLLVAIGRTGRRERVASAAIPTSGKDTPPGRRETKGARRAASALFCVTTPGRTPPPRSGARSGPWARKGEAEQRKSRVRDTPPPTPIRGSNRAVTGQLQPQLLRTNLDGLRQQDTMSKHLMDIFASRDSINTGYNLVNTRALRSLVRDVDEQKPTECRDGWQRWPRPITRSISI